MATTVGELIAKLKEVPEGWEAWATKAGGSIEVTDPEGQRYGYVFTYDNPTRMLTRHLRGEDS